MYSVMGRGGEGMGMRGNAMKWEVKVVTSEGGEMGMHGGEERGG